MMKEIMIESYAKINLSLDVTGKRADGYHEVDMMMQQLSFHDDVTIKYEPVCDIDKNKTSIEIATTVRYLPTDERNIAYKAAALIVEYYQEKFPIGKISIDIKKRIPVAAGLAGGSGNAAAVLHGLNQVLGLRLSLKKLCELSIELGSDIAFCLMGQAKKSSALRGTLVARDKYATSAARARGTGTDLQPINSIYSFVVFAKPNFGVSTKEVYKGIDACNIIKRPDNDKMQKALKEKNNAVVFEEMINVLELYTLEHYLDY